jgi:hypothetical protein
MLDANDVLTSSGKFKEFIARLDLHDVHQHNPAPSTYIGSSNRRIDYIFACHEIRGYTTASGTLSYLDGPQSDHRGLFVDINIADYLSYNANANHHITAKARTLQTGNPELVSSYNTTMLAYYKAHSLEERINTLQRNFQSMSKDDVRKELESWDRDQGRAMQQAERQLSIPRKPYAWSPKLRNAGIVRRYWKLRLRETKYREDYTQTIHRLQEQVKQSDPRFQFPFLYDKLSIDDIRKHLNQATKDLETIQQGSTEQRFQSYQDLLAIYKADTDPTTRPESNRKAKIVQRTIKTEKIRAMFRKIKNTMTQTLPNQQSGRSHE